MRASLGLVGSSWKDVAQGWSTCLLHANPGRCPQQHAPLFIVCVCVFCLHIFLCATCAPGALGDQKRAWNPLGLESHTVVNYHVSAGIEPRSSERAASALNCQCIISFLFSETESHTAVTDLDLPILLSQPPGIRHTPPCLAYFRS